MPVINRTNIFKDYKKMQVFYVFALLMLSGNPFLGIYLNVEIVLIVFSIFLGFQFFIT